LQFLVLVVTIGLTVAETEVISLENGPLPNPSKLPPDNRPPYIHPTEGMNPHELGKFDLKSGTFQDPYQNQELLNNYFKHLELNREPFGPSPFAGPVLIPKPIFPPFGPLMVLSHQYRFL